MHHNVKCRLESLVFWWNQNRKCDWKFVSADSSVSDYCLTIVVDILLLFLASIAVNTIMWGPNMIVTQWSYALICFSTSIFVFCWPINHICFYIINFHFDYTYWFFLPQCLFTTPSSFFLSDSEFLILLARKHPIVSIYYRSFTVCHSCVMLYVWQTSIMMDL